jgi:Na+/citrate or Na+/malate symporter
MTSEIASAPEHAAIEVNPRARFEILGAILLALFLGALDQTIVGPVLPKISTELNGADLYTWVVTAYLVTSTAAIPSTASCPTTSAASRCCSSASSCS